MSLVPQTLSLSTNNDYIDFGDLVRTLRRRWRQVAVLAVFTTCIAAYAVLSSHPQFTLNGALYFGDTQDSSNSGNGSDTDFISDFQNVNNVDTQVQLIQSKALVEQAILETGLNTTAVRRGTGSMPFWKWRFLNAEAIQVYAPQAGDITAQFATLADPGSRGGSYAVRFGANGQYQVLNAGDWQGRRPLLTGMVGEPASGGGLSLIVRPAVAGVVPPAGTEFTLAVTPAKALADRLLGGPLTIAAGGTPAEPTALATIKLLWSNPYQGKEFVDQLMQDFIATQLSWKTQSASNTENFIGLQLKKIRSSMADADNNLASYQAKTGIVDVPANAQAVISQLSQYQVQRTTVFLQQQALQQLVTATEHPTDHVNPYLVSQVNDPVLSQLAGNLATAEVQLAGQRVEFTALAPEAQVQEATVAKIEGSMHALIMNDEAMASRNLQDIDAMITKYQTQLRAMPAESLQVIALTRSSDVMGQLYVLLMQKEEEAEVSKAATIENTRIVTPAEVPLYATKPKGTITVLAGLLFGLLAGISIVLAQRALSERYQSDDEIRRAIPIRIYGLVPARRRDEVAKSVFASRPQSPFAQAFRLIRSNVYQAEAEAGSHVILMTSAGLGDGKTTVACNLAKLMSEDGKRVLLIDADLHQGHLHTTLGVPQTPGLSEWLTRNTPSPLQFLTREGFSVLTAGDYPLNPSELMNSVALANILEDLRSQFDFIIIDCPPLPVVSDTLTLVKYADLILSVVFLEHTSRRNFALHNEAIRAAPRRRGIIINGVTTVNHKPYGYNAAYAEGRMLRLTRRLRESSPFKKLGS